MNAFQEIDAIYPRELKILTPHDVVRYSFLAQKSVSYLDLSVCEYGNREKSVYTLEAAFKPIERQSSILYNLHLDVANVPHLFRNCCGNFQSCHPREIFILPYLYTKGFCIDFCDIVETSSNKSEAIRNLLRLIRVMKLKDSFEFIILLDSFPNILYREQCENSNLVTECMQTLCPKIKEWLLNEATPDLLVYVLRHTQKKGFYMWRDEGHLNPISVCIRMMVDPRVSLSTALEKIGGLMQYGYTFHFNENEDILYEVLRNILIDIIDYQTFAWFIERQRSPASRLREMLLLPVVIVYFHECGIQEPIPEGIVRFFRDFWNSILDPYSSRSEITNIFDLLIEDPELLDGICEFYRENVCNMPIEFFDLLQPRSLAHLCRIFIRNRMRMSNQLPHGIENLRLPNRLKDYLKLETYY